MPGYLMLWFHPNIKPCLQPQQPYHKTGKPVRYLLMATIAVASIARAAILPNSPVLGLPGISTRNGKFTCSMKRQVRESRELDIATPLLAAAAVVATSSPAMALVDERLSTEGTGLPFGVSNNLLVWIIIGVFGLIWSLYTIYTGTLEEDEDSGLSL